MGAGGAPVRRAGAGAAAPLASRAPAAARAQQRPLRRRVVVVTGPTASGKTSLSVELALRLNGEVVSADSVQVYERLDVGAAKATREERRGVPHHLLDVRSPLDGKDFSAGEFFDAARAATADVLDRGKVAVVAGGTGMYLRWFLHGKPATPQSTPEGSARARAALEAAADALGAGACEEQRWEAAVAALERAGDGVSGRKLARNDWYRLTRAMEIVQESGGIPKGQFSAPHKLAATGRGDNAEGTGAPAPTSLLGSSWAGSVASSAPLGEALDCDVHCFAVGVRPRQALYRAIDRRVEHMFQEGLLDEAAWLLESGAAPGSCCGARAIGYAQAIDLLVHTQQQGHQGTKQGGEGGEQGQGLAATADDVRRAVAETQRATRNFAKRQLTWLRGDATFAWLDGSDGTSAMADAVERALRGEQQSGDDAVRWSGALTKEEEREMRRYEGRLTDFAEGADAANEAAAWVTQWAMATPAAAAASAANAP